MKGLYIITWFPKKLFFPSSNVYITFESLEGRKPEINFFDAIAGVYSNLQKKKLDQNIHEYCPSPEGR